MKEVLNNKKIFFLKLTFQNSDLPSQEEEDPLLISCQHGISLIRTSEHSNQLKGMEILLGFSSI